MWCFMDVRWLINWVTIRLYTMYIYVFYFINRPSLNNNSYVVIGKLYTIHPIVYNICTSKT